MALGDAIDKVILILKTAIIGVAPAAVSYTNCKGIYDNDQLAFSAYPVICVGVPAVLNENIPVIAGGSVRDEDYVIEIIAYVKFADSAANTRQIITLTDSIRSALRADIKPPGDPCSGYCYQGELGDSRFFYGAKGSTALRCSRTLVKYIKRISP